MAKFIDQLSILIIAISWMKAVQFMDCAVSIKQRGCHAFTTRFNGHRMDTVY